jgi:hypothetical protein
MSHNPNLALLEAARRVTQQTQKPPAPPRTLAEIDSEISNLQPLLDKAQKSMEESYAKHLGTNQQAFGQKINLTHRLKSLHAERARAEAAAAETSRASDISELHRLTNGETRTGQLIRKLLPSA